MAETAHAGPYGGQASSGASAGPDGVKDQAQEKAEQVKEQGKAQAHQVAGQAKGRVATEVDRRSTEAGQKVTQQASDIRSVGEQLRSQGKEGPAKLADQAADRIDRVGGWLTTSDGERILHDVEDFARRQPWAVVAGGLALGFVASRFLKASSRDRYDRRTGGGEWQRTGSTSELYAGPQLPEQPGTVRPATPEEERFTRAGLGEDPLRPPAGSGGVS